MSIRISKPWSVQTANESALANKPNVSIAYTVKVGSMPSSTDSGTVLTAPGGFPLFNVNGALNQLLVYINGFRYSVLTPTLNLGYFIVVTWSKPNNRYCIYINGKLMQTGPVPANFNSTSTPWILGYTGAGNVDVTVDSLAAWNDYELVVADVAKLRDGLYTPATLIGSDSNVKQMPVRWWKLSSNNAVFPIIGDVGLTDSLNGFNFATINGVTANASYDQDIGYTPFAKLSAYITKGRLGCLFAHQNQVFKTPVNGTISVASNGTQVIVSSPQIDWVGKKLQIANDRTNTLYFVKGGYLNSFTIDPPYQDWQDAVNSAGTFINEYPAAAITAISSPPTFDIQFNKQGPFRQIDISKIPLFTPTSNASLQPVGLPCAFYQMFCGSLESILVQNPGANLTNPTVTASGNGWGLMLGKPILTGGITAYNKGLGGQNYTTAPTVVIPNPNVGGKPALATSIILSGSVVGIKGFVPGSNYPLGSAIPIKFAGGNGTGATGWTGVVTNTLGSIPIISAGKNYTGLIDIQVNDPVGSGVSVAAIMSGPTQNDNIRYSIDNAGVTTNFGSIGEVDNYPVINSADKNEPGYGGFLGFDLADEDFTIGVGVNISGPFGTPNVTLQPFANWMKHTAGVRGVVTSGFDRRPLSISGSKNIPPGYTFTFPQGDSGTDGQSLPVPTGDWKFVIDDTNGLNPLNVSCTSNNQSAIISNPVFTEGTLTTGITDIKLLAGGSNYGSNKVIVKIQGSNGETASAYGLVSNGSVIQLSLISPGVNLTGIPTITIIDPAGTGTGAFATLAIGPVLIGRMWQWHITPNGTQNDLDLTLNIWSNVGGAYPYTLTNEFLFDPLTPPDRNRVASNSFTSTLISKSGRSIDITRGMDCTMGTGGQCNIQDPDDLKNPWSWNWYEIPPGFLTSDQMAVAPTKSRSINIVSIQTYVPSGVTGFPWPVTWMSDRCYTNQWGIPNPEWQGYGPNFAGGPYYLNPTNVAWLAPNGAIAGNCAIECVTDDVHNLKTGDKILFSWKAGYFSVSNGISGVPVGNNRLFPGPCYIFVTAKDRFVLFQTPPNPPSSNSYTTMPGGMNNVAGQFPVTYVATIFRPEINAFAGMVPYGQYAKLVAQLPNSDIVVNLPPESTKATNIEIMNEIADNYPSGYKVHVETGNEVWNTGFLGFEYFYSMAAIGAWSGNNAIQSYVTRACDNHDTAYETFKKRGREGEIVRSIGTFYGVPATTAIIIAWANKLGKQIDEIMPAYYIIPPNDFSSITPLLATFYPTSPAYCAKNPLKRNQYADIYKHFAIYGLGNAFYMAGHQAAISGYTVNSAYPKLMGYEGGANNYFPSIGLTTLDPTNHNLYTQLTHDQFYDKTAADIDRAYLTSEQQWGFAQTNIFHYIGAFGGGGTNYGAACWPMGIWSCQPAGLGDGSPASNGVNIQNQFWADTQTSHHQSNAATRLGGLLKLIEGKS